jgi:predicted lysophospholipase L1 biosynthesis ABC-type transport system permease subunit
VFAIDGHARSDGGYDEALSNIVTPGYFATMGIAIRCGTDFANLNDFNAPQQAIVNEAFVRRYVNATRLELALGRTLSARGGRFAIVGVVADSISNAFGEPPTPAIYFSYRDRPSVGGEIHARAGHGSETALASDIRRVVRELDADLPVYNVRTLNEHIENNLIFRRIPAGMFSVLGPLLLILAAIGIYAVVAYTVSHRTAEIGVRLALGATGGRVVGLFVAQSLIVIVLGALAGWLLAFVVALDFVPGGTLDVPIFTGVPILLLSIATVACWLAARRASRVAPMVALRHD